MCKWCCSVYQKEYKFHFKLSAIIFCFSLKIIIGAYIPSDRHSHFAVPCARPVITAFKLAMILPSIVRESSRRSFKISSFAELFCTEPGQPPVPSRRAGST